MNYIVDFINLTFRSKDIEKPFPVEQVQQPKVQVSHVQSQSVDKAKEKDKQRLDEPLPVAKLSDALCIP